MSGNYWDGCDSLENYFPLKRNGGSIPLHTAVYETDIGWLYLTVNQEALSCLCGFDPRRTPLRRKNEQI
jgi:hypothetical protein